LSAPPEPAADARCAEFGKTSAAGRGARHRTIGRLLPAVPASAAGSTEDESKGPENEADQKNDPQNLQPRRQQTPASEDQKQENEDDQCSKHLATHLLGNDLRILRLAPTKETIQWSRLPRAVAPTFWCRREPDLRSCGSTPA